jgi:peptidoglycan/xylan/chitin deacetylase (PgdA/CDA1 family)
MRICWVITLVLIACTNTPQANSLRVVDWGDDYIQLRWDAVPGAFGYRIRHSPVSGQYPDMVDWNGYACAFSFSSDDGYKDNLVWADVFELFDKRFTIFATATTVMSGFPGRLTASDIDALDQRGFEIGAHGFTHSRYPFMSEDSVRIEFQAAKEYFEQIITDPAYECVTFAYPVSCHTQREMNLLMEYGYIAARNGGKDASDPPCPQCCSLGPCCSWCRTWAYSYHVPFFEVPNRSPEAAPNDSAQTYTRLRTRERIARWKVNGGQWANWFRHTLEQMDSLHLYWTLDEIVNDGDVWIAPFGEVAEYVRQFHIDVKNPLEADSLTCSAYVHDLPTGQIYVRVEAYNEDYTTVWTSNELSINLGEGWTGTPTLDGQPQYRLGSPTPNPTDYHATIAFWLDSPANASLALYDIKGRCVRVLATGMHNAGAHYGLWNTRGDNGLLVPSGVYFARLVTEHGMQTRKIAVVR